MEFDKLLSRGGGGGTRAERADASYLQRDVRRGGVGEGAGVNVKPRADFKPEGDYSSPELSKWENSR